MSPVSPCAKLLTFINSAKHHLKPMRLVLLLPQLYQTNSNLPQVMFPLFESVSHGLWVTVAFSSDGNN